MLLFDQILYSNIDFYNIINPHQLFATTTNSRLFKIYSIYNDNITDVSKFYYLILFFSIAIALISIISICYIRIRINQVKAKNEELSKHLSLALDTGKMSAWIYEIKKDSFILLKGSALNNGAMSSKEFNDFTHPEDKTILWDAIKAILDGKIERATVEFRLNTTGIDYRWYQCTLSIIYPEEGERFIIGTRKDISEEVFRREQLISTNKELIAVNKKIKNEEHYLRQVLNKLPVPIYIKDPINDNYIFQNKESVLLMGYLLGKTSSELLSAEESEKQINIDKKILETGEEYITNESLCFKNGKKIYSNVRKICLEIDDKKVILVARVDLTEQKRLIKELSKAKEKAEDSDKLKSAFLANMSHEIRTPLNAIVGFSELMLNCESKDERNEYMKIISYNNELLLRLISDILDLSKIESGMLFVKPEVFDLNELFDNIFKTYNEKLKTGDLKLIYQPNYEKYFIKTDRNKLMQVITNYIGNAIKYTPKGEIKIGFQKESDGTMIWVRDTGIGIAKEKHNQVFVRFAKFDSFAQGSGLGLSISKAITELLGGKVGFESEQNAGSYFWAWIPKNINEEDIKTAQNNNKEKSIKELSIINKSLPKLKILIAEDIDSNYHLMKVILKDHDTKRALNGKLAIEEVKLNDFDFILMDMKMPILDGIRATKLIREFNTNTPIIAVTANAFDSDRVDAIKAGCNDFVTKPLKKKDIINVLSRHYNR